MPPATKGPALDGDSPLDSGNSLPGVSNRQESINLVISISELCLGRSQSISKGSNGSSCLVTAKHPYVGGGNVSDLLLRMIPGSALTIENTTNTEGRRTFNLIRQDGRDVIPRVLRRSLNKTHVGVIP